MYPTNAESINDQNPFLIGTVVDNKDPTNSYRVKIRLPKIHSKIADSDLPWAARVDRAFRGIKSNTPTADGPESNDKKDDNKESKKKNPPKFDHCVPEVGTKVLVLAIGNDMNALVYMGALYKKTDYTPTDEKKYLNTYGIYADEDQFIGIDGTGDEENEIKVHFIGHIDVDKVKKVTVNAEEDITVKTKKNISQSSEENTTESAKKNFIVNAGDEAVIQINQGESEEKSSIFITVNKDGNIKIKSTKIILEGDVEIKGKVDITGNTDITGTVHSTGELNVDSNIKSKVEVSAKNGSVNLSTHKHKYIPGISGSADTGTGTG